MTTKRILKKKQPKTADRGERRVVDRGHLVFYLRVFDGENNRMHGHVTDISTDGFMLASDKKLAENKQFHLKMLLPKEVSGRVELNLEAKSCWCKPDANPDFYISGYQFMDLDEQAVRLVKKLIEDFSIEKSLQLKDTKTPACNLTHTTGR